MPRWTAPHELSGQGILYLPMWVPRRNIFFCASTTIMQFVRRIVSFQLINIHKVHVCIRFSNKYSGLDVLTLFRHLMFYHYPFTPLIARKKVFTATYKINTTFTLNVMNLPRIRRIELETLPYQKTYTNTQNQSSPISGAAFGK